MSNWMDELADKTFNVAMKATIKSMRNELRKNKIKQVFGADVCRTNGGTLG